MIKITLKLSGFTLLTVFLYTLLNTWINNDPKHFLQPCYKRKYISSHINIYDVLEEAGRALFKEISGMPGHPFYPSLPKQKKAMRAFDSSKQPTSRINNKRFKNSFIN